MRIQAIVEGHGDVSAVPELLRRLAHHSQPVDVLRPIRIPRGKLVKQDGLQRAVALAAKYVSDADAILVIFDADGDCPALLAPELLGWARDARADRSVAVVIAKNEFEAWFLAAAESLAAAGKLADGTAAPADPESVRDAKGWPGHELPLQRDHRSTGLRSALRSRRCARGPVVRQAGA